MLTIREVGRYVAEIINIISTITQNFAFITERIYLHFVTYIKTNFLLIFFILALALSKITLCNQ